MYPTIIIIFSQRSYRLYTPEIIIFLFHINNIGTLAFTMLVKKLLNVRNEGTHSKTTTLQATERRVPF